MKKITSRMVAHAAGVAQSTVSKVMNHCAGITPETQAAVIRAARDLGYHLSSAHGSARKNIAVVVPFGRCPFEGFIGNMLTELTRELIRHNMRQELIPDDDLGLLNERWVDGGITLGWDAELGRRWGDLLPAPLIRINSVSDHTINCYSVSLDGDRSMEELVEYLWNRGHRRIVQLHFESREHEEQNMSRRSQGFIAAMARRGVANPAQFCVFNCERHSVEELSVLIAGLLKQKTTALITSNEMRTLRVDRALRILNVRVPEELSWVGWEMEDISQYLTPPLTTLAIDRKAICRCAVELLERCLAHDPTVNDIRIPYHFHERDSVGMAPDFSKAHVRAHVKIQQEERIRAILRTSGPLSRKELAARLGIKPQNGHFRRRIAQLAAAGIIEYTAGARRSSLQKLRVPETASPADSGTREALLLPEDGKESFKHSAGPPPAFRPR